ncbi:mitochondrial genome maintenance protein [Diaporthe amygdali]|uniref:mitochondrial genome maintenance protein n=1 Tax=Phomopsis amygdali TaxID=1214568 RepID=UPI0022FEC817|nr:mitochondrial genome maintenance protein [Diaporthe amygdali]KAJ0119594.1 mitochondrial genome maintenance protein [Diaporthe amygdali]
MTRIISSAMRPLRLNGSRAIRFRVSAEPAQVPSFEARRAATTYTRSTAAPASKTPPPQTPYKRSATTSAATTTKSSNSNSTAKPTPSSSTAKNTNTPFAESQTNPAPSAPYSPPQGMNSIPEAPTAFSSPVFATPAAPSGDNGIDWSSSFHGLSTVPFSPEVAAVLMKPIPFEDVEIKPDGIIYLPEIKYRRILNQAFGPGGWGMAPRGELTVGERVVTREYALLVHGRFIAQARGECQYFADDGIATAGEGCKSNALMRCCKDLGIASELWDPRYIRDFKKKWAQEIWVEHVVTKKKRQTWVRKGDDPAYPFKKS